MSTHHPLLAPLAVLVLGAAAATGAHAQAFTGSSNATLAAFAPVPDLARCGAAATNARRDWTPAPGTSNFGAFTFSSSDCLDRSTGTVFNGLFTFDFGAGRTLVGTYVGTFALPLPPTVGVPSAISETLTITGGTGTFAGAGGSITGAGSETVNANSTYDLRLNFVGTVSAVPEPATMLLLGAGLLGVGMVARRRRGVPADAGASTAAR